MNVLLAKINNELLMRFRANGFEPLNLTMKHRPPETIQIVPILRNGERPYDLKDVVYFNVVIYPACAHVCHSLPEVAELIINAPKAYFEKMEEESALEQYWFVSLKNKDPKMLTIGLSLNETTSDVAFHNICENLGVTYEYAADAMAFAKDWQRFQDRYQEFYGVIPQYEQLQKTWNKERSKS